MRLATPNFGSLEGDFAAVAEVQGDDVSWTSLDFTSRMGQAIAKAINHPRELQTAGAFP